jgi:ABC-type uncharacterized transport system ATPase component
MANELAKPTTEARTPEKTGWMTSLGRDGADWTDISRAFERRLGRKISRVSGWLVGQRRQICLFDAIFEASELAILDEFST